MWLVPTGICATAAIAEVLKFPLPSLLTGAPASLIIFVLTARQAHHPWAPLRGSGNFQITSCTTLERQEIQQRGCESFLFTRCPSHYFNATASPPCWSMNLLPPQASSGRQMLWGAPNSSGVFLMFILSILLHQVNRAWWQIQVGKLALPSSWIFLHSRKTQRSFSLSEILALARLPEVFTIADCIQKLIGFWTHHLPEQWMSQWVESWGQQANWRKEKHLLFSWNFISPQQNPWHHKSLGNGFTV